jgi:hypothetical protein
LCDEARPVVEAVVEAAGGQLVEIDIERSDDLVARYGVRIPVVAGPGGEVLAEGQVERRELQRRLKRFLRSDRGGT